MNCPKCNSEQPDNAKFCKSCGAKLPKMKWCAHCGTPLPFTAKFCNKCGFQSISNNIRLPERNEAANNVTAPRVPTNSNPQAHLNPQNSQNSHSPENPPAPRNIEQPVNPEYKVSDVADFDYPENNHNLKIILYGVFTFILLAIIGGGIWLYISEDKAFKNDIQKTSWKKNDNSEPVMEQTEIAQSAGSLNDIVYLQGSIDGKYDVSMMLDFKNKTGKYCYDKYGPSNSMTLQILEHKDNSIKLNEYSNGNYCGEWFGEIVNGHFVGRGTFLDKKMPFDLSIIAPSASTYYKTQSAPMSNSMSYEGYTIVSNQKFPISLQLTYNNGTLTSATYKNIKYGTTQKMTPVSGSSDEIVLKANDGNSNYEFKLNRNSNGRELTGYFVYGSNYNEAYLEIK